jgi:hypothetical protein
MRGNRRKKMKKRMARRKRILAVLTVVLALISSRSLVSADDDDLTRPTLRGLPGIHVMISPLRLEIEQEGLTRARLQTRTESILQDAGIGVLSREKWFKAEGMPFLSVSATVLKLEGTGGYAYHISLELRQAVYLVRTRIQTYASTWSIGGIGICRSLDDVQAEVEEQMHRFVHAYSTVNPK